ncbi:TfoX/Sxy family protein [Ciceribacter sp. L1K22]|uniref:TfoX/Sxy family protein n=1 Tax=Ciceribacter sp. L1K22 TaxID=2820275 RepID=UPI001ABDE723|nr:TfoX/Sxy family protein [Ciceribacter sp. L1K22]
MDTIDIEEMFQSLGPVTIKRMFGGKGIYHHGVIIAIDLFDEIMLKADTESGPQFAEAGATQWVYQREGKSPVAMPYWTIPDGAYDDPDEMAKWVGLAYEAGLRAGPTVPKKKSAKKRKDGAGKGR